MSLHVAGGETVDITGPSGSGKSGLLAVASTLITPDTGTVTVDGVNATEQRTLPRLSRALTMVDGRMSGLLETVAGTFGPHHCARTPL